MLKPRVQQLKPHLAHHQVRRLDQVLSPAQLGPVLLVQVRPAVRPAVWLAQYQQLARPSQAQVL